MPATAIAPTREIIDILEYTTNVVGYYNYSPPANTMLLGLEWEMLGNPSLDHLRLALGTARLQSPTFIAKRDGSVSRGLELVTLPQTLDEHYVMLDLLEEAAILSNSSCGVHVHLTRALLGANQLARMWNVINVSAAPMQTFINRVARRGQNMYCARNRNSGLAIRDIHEAYTNHYSAIGVSERHPTVELRIFASTNKVRYIKSYLQFAMALAHYCSDVNSTYNQEDPRAFIELVNQNPTLYPDLNHRFQTAAPFAEYRTSPVDPTTPDGAPPRTRSDAPVGYRRLPASGNRERRTQSTVPSTQDVRDYLRERMERNGYDPTNSMAEYAASLRRRTRSNAMTHYVSWYTTHCYWDNPSTGVRENQTIVTANGHVVTGRDIRQHALYHLSIVANAEEVQSLISNRRTSQPVTYIPRDEPDADPVQISPALQETFNAYCNGEVPSTQQNRSNEEGVANRRLEVDIAVATERVLNSLPRTTRP